MLILILIVLSGIGYMRHFYFVGDYTISRFQFFNLIFQTFFVKTTFLYVQKFVHILVTHRKNLSLLITAVRIMKKVFGKYQNG